MATDVKPILAALAEQFSGVGFAAGPLNPSVGDGPSVDAGAPQTAIRVSPERLLEVLRFLRSDVRCSFEQLCDLTCIDYLNFPDATDRFGVVYSLLSISLGHRLWVKCFVNDPNPTVPTATVIWKGAEWMEREVYDMFGIRFEGHPDLRRILTWDGFKAHPLRKDYPLRGRGEREDFPVISTESA